MDFIVTYKANRKYLVRGEERLYRKLFSLPSFVQHVLLNILSFSLRKKVAEQMQNMECVASGGNKGERRFAGKRERASSSSPLNLETFLVYGFSGECHAKTRYYALKAFPIFEQGT